MKTSPVLSRFASCVALAVTVAFASLAAGCASTATQESTGEYLDNSVITTKVKAALASNEIVKSFAVSVESVKGVVQLSGFVDSAAQKAEAGRVAAGITGVESVQNNLIVKSATQ